MEQVDSCATRTLVCYTAVFSVVTQRSSPLEALCDDTENGCVADYQNMREEHARRKPHNVVILCVCQKVRGKLKEVSFQWSHHLFCQQT